MTHGRRAGGWSGIAFVGTAFAIIMLGTTLPTPLYPIYAARFGFGELVTTLVFAVYAVGVMVGLLLFGHWSDQLGRRPMLLAGALLSALSAVAYLLPGALGWLFVGRVLSGLSAGIVTGTATATIVDLAPAAGRARAGLVAAVVNMAGLGLGPLLAGVLSQYAPMPVRLCFVVDLVLVAVAVLCLLVVREPVERRAERDLRPRRLQVPVLMRGVFTRAAVGGFAAFAVLGLFTAVSPSFLGDVLHHHNRALVGVIVLCLFVPSILGQAASVRFGAEQGLRIGCAVLIVGMVVLGASLPSASLTLLVVGAVVAGFGLGTTFRAGLGSVSAASPDAQRGEITSTYFIVLYVGIAIPVVGVGALAGAAGLVTAGVVFSAVVAALAATALVLVSRSSAATPR